MSHEKQTNHDVREGDGGSSSGHALEFIQPGNTHVDLGNTLFIPIEFTLENAHPDSYWRFEEGAGLTTADETAATHWTLANGPNWVDGRSGRSTLLATTRALALSLKEYIGVLGITEPHMRSSWQAGISCS